MAQPLALVIDDEPDIRELVELTLSRMNIATRTAKDVREAHILLSQQNFDLCLTDMRLPDGNGIELVEHIQANYPNLPVAVITAHGNMESAITALKAGAFDFVSKPVDLKILRSLVNTALKISSERGVTDDTQQQPQLLGESTVMQMTKATISKLARSQAPIYISGESGTGKELAARMIHEQGPRHEKAFIPVNCGAIPEALMESEFFGHKKGSFTGAHTDKQGLFSAADGGTLFLDEVADLPLHMQVKLLRAIQEKAIRAVGAQQETSVNARILCATHKDLAALVQAGDFRQDLYYRLNVIELHMPSLRERREDIEVLAEHLLKSLASQSNTTAPRLTDAALSTLSDYPFPGNVRELENILERAMTLCEQQRIAPADLCLPEPATTETIPTELTPHLGNVEKETIQRALEQTRYNKTAAAKLLGISFGALRYRLKKLGLE